MSIKEKLKAFVPPSANTFHSFTVESNEANGQILAQGRQQSTQLDNMSMQMQQCMTKISELSEKINNKKFDIPDSMKPPYFFDLRLQAIQWETFDELESWLDTLDNVALFELQDINTRFFTPATEYQLFQPEFLLYHTVDEARAHLPRYKALYEQLMDDTSKRTLVSLFLSHIVNSNRLLWKHFKTVIPGVAPWEHVYFNPTVMHHEDGCDEVFVDCGAYDGQGAFNFMYHYSEEYKRMYLYEFDPINAMHVKESTKMLPNVIIRDVAVGSKPGKMASMMDSSQGSHLSSSDNGNYTTEVVTLDDDIAEPITFLKMDIEGAELDALRGSANHIRNEHPKLAICVYHKREDVVDIGEYILSLNPNYKLYLRHEEHYMYCGTVLYAIP